MKKLSNTEGELKKSVACKKKRVVLNNRFSFFEKDIERRACSQESNIPHTNSSL